ncbi:MAG: trypsin-like peptidase domain-containing protein [Roseiflexus sp.]|nr:trypsin-like peptidase domain-containing protein [Roseiflexus sp.]MCS7290643.1 trypsin-like peptidase domain-containing protein [Roseiflexus sp.]MDW8231435.1 trypsin-like peptidase domain-containing protein [Roseiflexaceae bacterium]
MMTQVSYHSSLIAGFADLAEQTRRSVVHLHGAGRGSGTGVVWQPGGVVLTNDHVVAGAGGALRAQTLDGRDLPVTVKARSQNLDLAVLHIPANDLPPVPVGDSTRLRVGELVFAIGHPWGQPWVVTAGIVSGLGEAETRSGQRIAFIRSDVRLAPGNSGGPLLNARGRVIGINAMVFGGDLSVAIASHIVEQWLNSVQGQRMRLGVGVQPSPLPAGLLNGRSHGLLVVRIEPGSPAERAGVMVGDLLLHADTVSLERPEDLRTALQRAAGAAVRLRLLRAGNIRVIDAPLNRAPQEQ